MRFDGYYILSDLLEVPNLMQRSMKMLQHLAQKYLYRVENTRPPASTASEQATLLICSSLDVEVSLSRCFQFIRDYLPADAIYLNIYEPSISGIRYIAMADDSGGRKIEKSIKLPADLIDAIESGRRLKDYLIINRPQQDPMGEIITGELHLADHSFIALRLFVEGHRLGVIDLFARGLWDSGVGEPVTQRVQAAERSISHHEAAFPRPRPDGSAHRRHVRHSAQLEAVGQAVILTLAWLERKDAPRSTDPARGGE